MAVRDHTAAYICSHVFDASRPVLLVAREDGDWMLLCGAPHDFEAEPPKVVGIGHLLARDATLAQVLDLANGFEAERASVGGAWERRQSSDDEHAA